MIVRRALLAIVLVVAGCGGNEAAPRATTKTGAASTRPVEAKPSRPPAPAINGESLDGEPISLAGFRGRPVFVLVWSSW